MTLRLLYIAEDRWEDVDGYGVAHGFDPYTLPLARLVNFIWWFTTRNAQQKDVDKFRSRLWRPPKGQEVTHEKSPWSAAAENNALSALKNALGGKSTSG